MHKKDIRKLPRLHVTKNYRPPVQTAPVDQVPSVNIPLDEYKALINLKNALMQTGDKGSS